MFACPRSTSLFGTLPAKWPDSDTSTVRRSDAKALDCYASLIRYTDPDTVAANVERALDRDTGA